MQGASPRPEIRVLAIVSPSVRQLLSSAGEENAWAIDPAGDIDSGIAKLRYMPYDVVLVELSQCSVNQSVAIQMLTEACPATDVIVLVEKSTPQHVIEAIRSRAFGYFSKPFDLPAIRDMIRSAATVQEPSDAIEIMSANPNYLTLRLRCSLSTVDRLVRFMAEIPIELTDDDREEMGTAFRELLLNAIEHGGKLNPNEWVRVSRVRTNRTLVYHIQDPGDGFVCDRLDHAAAPSSEDPLAHVCMRDEAGIRAGGFGMLIATSLVDEVIYNEQGNEVILIKYLI
jgi:anti-sigma regulatory factor (Ser/Thr protein kinase)/CheY-like chemotaxis protein